MKSLVVLFNAPLDLDSVPGSVIVAGAVFPAEVVSKADPDSQSLELHLPEKIERRKGRIFFTIQGYEIGLAENLVARVALG